ncbi:GntP family permease [Magnetospirillum sulfuroxidans]|uniref:GntP family permease n=1 Tax=Magnetospirillum sulfuroxidans TaxID=611300 RepID=A0ABS5I9D8_9PROT|nr:GntP family permease [Magnetospirillum sulfuroxidans]MBR9971051.1 GntP family permease [Magnetospirillum sulfuroxidans]
MWLITLLVLAIGFIIFATAKLKMHAFLALLLTAFAFGVLAGMPLDVVVKSVNDGFGGTIGSIGIVIILGSVIGTFLEKSGGAWRLAEGILKVTGKKNVPLTMSIMGYVVSIPVFCDSGFVILSSLNKALAKRAGVSLAAGAIALSLGLYTTHTMVPPTPGPIAAAGILQADLGLVILWGGIIAALACVAGWIFAVTVAAKVDIAPYKDGEEPTEIPSLDQAPSPLASLLPIFLPIVLIVLKSLSDLPSKPFGAGDVRYVLSFIGQPVVALLLGFGLALFLPKKLEKDMLGNSGWFGQAIINSAIIILITGAGGAFGKVLQNSGIAKLVGETLASMNLGIFLPFLVAAGIKTAQGSSTVAIITAAGLMAPLMTALGFDAPMARALVVVAIGAGAMVVSHANDSFFWVVTQFSNMTPEQGYKLQTLGTLFQGVVAAVAVYVVAAIVL